MRTTSNSALPQTFVGTPPTLPTLPHLSDLPLQVCQPCVGCRLVLSHALLVTKLLLKHAALRDPKPVGSRYEAGGILDETHSDLESAFAT